MKLMYHIPTPVIGGAETQLACLVKYLRPYGHDILVAFSDMRTSPFANVMDVATVQAKTAEDLTDVIDRFAPDVLQFFHSPVMYTALSRIACRPKVAEVIHSRHAFGGDASTYPKDRSNVAVCVSPDAEAWFREKVCRRTPTVVIPNGIDRERFIPRQPRPMRRVPLGGFAGRLDGKEKAILELIEVVAQLPIRFQLVGRGADKWRAVCADLPNIELIDHTDDVVAYYHSWDFFVSRCPCEGFGMAIGEALMCGLPSVIYECGGICRYIENGHHALLVDSDAAMAAAIRKVIGGLPLHPLDFSLDAERMASEYDALYRAMTTSGGFGKREAVRPAAVAAPFRSDPLLTG